MSQPVLIAMLTVAIAISITASIAVIVSAADAQAARTIKLVIVSVFVAVGIVLLEHASVRVNFTASMPVGIYSLTALSPNAVKRGMLVAACAPIHAAEVGWKRGYLARGPCADGTELLLKSVVAIAEDEVNVTAAGVAVNGCLLPHSQPVLRDHSERRLTRWPLGHYWLKRGQLWLYAPNDRSWDSRYWGPAAAADVVARAVPLLGFAPALSERPGCGLHAPLARIVVACSKPGAPCPLARVLTLRWPHRGRKAACLAFRK